MVTLPASFARCARCSRLIIRDALNPAALCTRSCRAAGAWEALTFRGPYSLADDLQKYSQNTVNSQPRPAPTSAQNLHLRRPAGFVVRKRPGQ